MFVFIICVKIFVFEFLELVRYWFSMEIMYFDVVIVIMGLINGLCLWVLYDFFENVKLLFFCRYIYVLLSISIIGFLVILYSSFLVNGWVWFFLMFFLVMWGNFKWWGIKFDIRVCFVVSIVCFIYER